MLIPTRILVPGECHGDCVFVEPFSFWGGFDPTTGCISEPSHPSFGLCLSDLILIMVSGRGSSSSSSVLAEGIRRGTAPRAIITRELDTILVIGSMVAGGLYGSCCPVRCVDASHWSSVICAKRLTLLFDTMIAINDDPT